MRLLLIGLIALTITSASFATTCKDLYRQDKWGSVGISEDAGMAILGTGTAGFAMSGFIGAMTVTSSQLIPVILVGTAAGPVAILGGIGATAGAIAIHNHKPNKMIKLIEQSELYSKVQGTPGKQLRMLSKKLDNKYSLKEIADYISAGNRDLSLCSTDLVSFRNLKNMIRSGEIILITND